MIAWVHDRLTDRKLNRVFRRKTDPYRYATSPYEQSRIDKTVSLIRFPVKNVLEIGCAEGVLTERLMVGASHVTAVDISGIALERARDRLAEKGTNVDFQKGNIRELIKNYAVGEFDLIVASEVLYYLGHGDSKGVFFEKPFVDFLSELKRVLAPAGQMVLAHGYGNESERKIRENYSTRLNSLGLRTVTMLTVGDEKHDKGSLRCLIALHSR